MNAVFFILYFTSFYISLNLFSEYRITVIARLFLIQYVKLNLTRKRNTATFFRTRHAGRNEDERLGAQSRSSRRGILVFLRILIVTISLPLLGLTRDFDSCSLLIRDSRLLVHTWATSLCVSRVRRAESAPEATPSREECRSRRRVGLQNISVCAFASPRFPSRADTHRMQSRGGAAASSMRERQNRLAKPPAPPRFLA